MALVKGVALISWVGLSWQKGRKQGQGRSSDLDV